MRYWTYLKLRFKYNMITLVGFIISFGGIVFIYTNLFIGLILLLLGIVLFFYGIFKLGEFYFNREEPRRMYHHKGRFH